VRRQRRHNRLTKKGRPRINPAASLTDAERAVRYHAKHRDRINRTRRLRA
jgi:hypothetical protein